MTRLTLLVAVLLVAACTGAPQANLSVSARSAAATSITAAPSSTPASLDLGNGITLERVRVVVRKLELEGGPSRDGSGTPALKGSSHAESPDDHVDRPVIGPLLADLRGAALSAGLQEVFRGEVPTGTFRELKIAIGPIGLADAHGDAGLEEMARQQASLVLEGTVDGKPFRFVSGLVEHLELEGEIVLAALASNNITLSLDPEAWFGGAGAARLDPSDPANQSRIEGNVKSSIRAFEDDDRSGEDDHGGHHGGGGTDDGAGHS